MKPPKIYSILPKLLHNTQPKPDPSVKTASRKIFLTEFFDTKMDFYFRKVLKHNKIAYSWDRKKRYLTVNTPTSPFRFFMIFEEDSNYITIRKIPWNDFEYKINAISVEDLINKMVRYKIIVHRNLQMLIVPMALKAEQMELVDDWA